MHATNTIAALTALLSFASQTLAQVQATRTYPNATTTFGTGVNAPSLLSSISGPFMFGFTYSWSQYIFPTTVGTVEVVVNEATNQTSSTTIFHSEYQANGSVAILSRTDTNAAGTVTETVEGANNQFITVAYPTHVNNLNSIMSWDAILPTVINQTINCCEWGYTTSMTPVHTPFPVDSGSTDGADPSGWLYHMVGESYGLDSPEISSLWSTTQLSVAYTGCPLTSCPPRVSSTADPAVAASTAAYLLATSTRTISAAATTATSALNPGATFTDPSSVRVDPIATTDGETDPAVTSEAPTNIGNDDQPTATTGASPPETETTNNGDDQPTTVVQSPPGTQTDENSINPPNTALSPETQTIDPPQSEGGVQPAALPTTPEIVVGEQTVVQQSDSAFIISGQTLFPGSSITLGSGTETTLVAVQTGPAGTAVQVGASSLVTLPATIPSSSPPNDLPAIITVGDSLVSADSASNYIIEGQTLGPGGSAIVVSGTTVSLAPGATQIVVDGSTQLLATVATAVSAEALPALTIGDSVITADSASVYVIEGQTLAPGSSIVVSGTTIALAPGATEVVVGASTQVLATAVPTAALPTLTFGNSAVTADSESRYIVAGQTLAPGSTIVVSGTTISLAPEATQVVVGDSTHTLTPSANNVGGYVWSAIGGTSSPTQSGPLATEDVTTEMGSAPPQQTTNWASRTRLDEILPLTVACILISLCIVQ